MKGTQKSHCNDTVQPIQTASGELIVTTSSQVHIRDIMLVALVFEMFAINIYSTPTR